MTNETIVDIIAEMSRVEVCADGKPCLRDYADRLDRARMKTEIEMANLRKENAKLREALKDIGRIVEQIRLLYSDYPYEIHVIARKASAALAAPPRNCDTMSESVCAAYFDALYNGNRDGVCMATTEREKNIHRYYCKYINWLFATAKAKGGAK